MDGEEEVEVADGLEDLVKLGVTVPANPGALEAPPWHAVESTVTRQRSASRAFMTKS